MTYTIYGARRSGSFTPEALLAEAGAAYRLIPVNLDHDEQAAAAYRAVNPLARVPTLILPDGQVVSESAAILLVIAERHPEAGLLPPAASGERAVLYRWLMAIATGIYEAVGRWDYPGRYTTDPAGAPGIRAAAQDELRRLWGLVEEHLAPEPYALGARFSALDVYIANLSRWIVGNDWLDAHCPRLQRLAGMVAARPAIAPIWAAHFGEPG